MTLMAHRKTMMDAQNDDTTIYAEKGRSPPQECTLIKGLLGLLDI